MSNIYELIEEQDFDNTKVLIEADPSIVNAIDGLRNQPLHVAAYSGNVNIARLLVDSGANVNGLGDMDRTPLHYAAIENDAEIARLLVENNAELGAIDLLRNTPLYYAVQGQVDLTDVATVLLNHHTPIDLNAAVWLLNAKELRERLVKSPDGFHGAPDPHRLASDAVMRGDPDVLTALLDNGASLDGVPAHRPIIDALSRPQLLQILLERGAKATVKDSMGRTILEAAQQAGVSGDVIELLRKYGASTRGV